MEDVSFMSLFRVTVEHLLEDLEPDAVITCGVTFERARKRDVEDLVERIFQGLRRHP